MQSTTPDLIRKTRSSCVALFTAGAMLSATFFGCSSRTPAKPDGDLGARSEIFTNYLSTNGDQKYQVDAPELTLRDHGIAKYDVKIANQAIHVGSLDQAGTQLASIEMTPSDVGLRFDTNEGAVQHTYVIRATGAVEDKNFNLHLTYDGKEFTVGYNARGQIVTTGDLAYAPPAASPLMKQMWRDIIPAAGAKTVITEQAMSQCFACFLCGAGSVLLAAALAGVIWLGWTVLAPIITIAFTQGTAAAIAALQAAGVAVTLATAAISAVVALGWGLVKVCYKCITGNDLFKANTDKANFAVGSGSDTGSGSGSGSGSDTGSGSGSGSDTGSGSGSDTGSGSGSDTGSGSGSDTGSGSGSDSCTDPITGGDTCSCPVETEITPELAKAFIPAFN